MKIQDQFEDEDVVEQDGIKYVCTEIPTTIEPPNPQDYKFILDRIAETNRLKRQLSTTQIICIFCTLALSTLWYFYGLPNSSMSKLNPPQLYSHYLFLTILVPPLCICLKNSTTKWVRLVKSMKRLNNI